jgi:hypothetical protein
MPWRESERASERKPVDLLQRPPLDAWRLHRIERKDFLGSIQPWRIERSDFLGATRWRRIERKDFSARSRDSGVREKSFLARSDGAGLVFSKKDRDPLAPDEVVLHLFPQPLSMVGGSGCLKIPEWP